MIRENKNKTTQHSKIKKLNDEPALKPLSERFDFEYTKALNWYNYLYTAKEGRGWLEKYQPIKKETKEKIDNSEKILDNVLSEIESLIDNTINDNSVKLDLYTNLVKKNIPKNIIQKIKS